MTHDAGGNRRDFTRGPRLVYYSRLSDSDQGDYVKLRLAFLLALGAIIAVVPTAAHGTTLHAESNSQTYQDSVGENPNAPDITTINVANDDAGNITFKIDIANRPQLTSDMLMFVFLDTDGKTTTGDPTEFGADYAIQLQMGAVDLFKWSDSAKNYVSAPSQTSLSYSYDTTGATIHINATDLAGTKAFDFQVVVLSGITTDAQGNQDFSQAQSDAAPDPGHGAYSYQVLTKLELTRTAFTTTPTPALAGSRLAASLSVDENDTGEPISSGTISCAATIGKARLTATHTLTNGVATCFWKVPKTAKGKTVHGTVTVTVRGVSLKKTFSAPVR
jgi:hypothetical protein